MISHFPGRSTLTTVKMNKLKKITHYSAGVRFIVKFLGEISWKNFVHSTNYRKILNITV